MVDVFQRKWRIVKGDPILFHMLEQANFTLVKENPRRKVWLAQLPGDAAFYLKQEKLPPLHAIFLNPAKKEFENAAALIARNIPCVHFTHFALRGLTETLLISEAVQNAVSAKEFWFTNADANLRSDFLENLRLLIAMLMGNKIRHDDFHAGNLLVNRKTAEITLVDPLKVTFHSKVDFSRYAQVCTNFLPDFTSDDFRSLSADFISDPDAAFADVIRKNEDLIDREWNRRKIQILSGNSKFSHTVVRNARTFQVAATAYFIQQDLPPDIDHHDKLVLTNVVAEQMWLQQFNDILKGKASQPKFIARELCGQSQILYS